MGLHLKWACYLALAIGALISAYEYQRSKNSLEGLMNPWNRASLEVSSWFTWESLKLLFLYFLWLYIMSFLVPGYAHKGTKIRDGRVLTFYCNGLPILFITFSAYVWLCHNGFLKWTCAYDHFPGLLVWCNVVILGTSLYLYIRGRLKGLSSGDFYEDFVMGQELVPEVLGLKLNFFWLRPSMMLWLFINLSFLAKHYQDNGRSVSDAMLFYQVFTNWYIVDYFLFEEFVTSTWDIIAEKFGFMLVWGDLVFIPFTFSLQAWFLLNDRTKFSLVEKLLIGSLFVTGYTIFRFANKQKHDFKKDPTALVWGKKPETIGNRLLVSGWWGLASHINYLGDLILAISYAAPCGLWRTGSFIPWFYPIYLFILLIHRDWRDDQKCAEKYGKLWVEYRKRVPYRILPGVY